MALCSSHEKVQDERVQLTKSRVLHHYQRDTHKSKWKRTEKLKREGKPVSRSWKRRETPLHLLETRSEGGDSLWVKSQCQAVQHEYCWCKGARRWKLVHKMPDVKFKLGISVWWDFRMFNINGRLCKCEWLKPKCGNIEEKSQMKCIEKAVTTLEIERSLKCYLSLA